MITTEYFTHNINSINRQFRKRNTAFEKNIVISTPSLTSRPHYRIKRKNGRRVIYIWHFLQRQPHM